MPFQLIPSDVWQLGARVQGARRGRLLQTPFDETVALVVSNGHVSHIRLKPSDTPGFRRLEVQLRTSPVAVDTFHNGAGGYRAQFYAHPHLGEECNRIALQQLRPFVLAAIADRFKFEPDRLAAIASLIHETTKIWIHQGQWHRLMRHEDRNLVVARWKEAVAAGCPLPKKRLPTWATLTPAQEDTLDIKGAWLDQEGGVGPSVKPFRSLQICYLGFT